MNTINNAEWQELEASLETAKRALNRACEILCGDPCDGHAMANVQDYASGASDQVTTALYWFGEEGKMRDQREREERAGV